MAQRSDPVDFVPDPASPAALRSALGRFATGVTVVTTAAPDGPAGFIANSFASLSLDPPLVLWAPGKASLRFALFAAARNYAIHVLALEQEALVRRFTRGGAGFDGLDHDVTEAGVPVLKDALARYDCERYATHEGGDHLIVVGRLLRVRLRDGDPLVFSQGTYGRFASGDSRGGR
ncbi:MAG: flavin reductase family protein [Pseudomonadota bacterium]